MSKRNDIGGICFWLWAIYFVLFIIMINQCSSQEDIHRDLQNIEHELRMLRYNTD